MARGPSPPRPSTLQPLGVDPLAHLEVERHAINKPAHVGGGALDVVAALALAHLDAVGQKLSEASDLELLEGQSLGGCSKCLSPSPREASPGGFWRRGFTNVGYTSAGRRAYILATPPHP